jgi:Domain of unknown function (DUF4440)
MKRFVANALFVTLVCCSAIVGVLSAKPADAPDDAVVQADRAVVQALDKGDRAAAEKLLDVDFTWITPDGILWAKEDAFHAGIKPLIPDASEEDHGTQVRKSDFSFRRILATNMWRTSG